LPARWRKQALVTYPGKRDRTFSEAITAVRCWLWSEWVFEIPEHKAAFAKMPPRLRAALLRALAPAA